jgi:hypothetical protein
MTDSFIPEECCLDIKGCENPLLRCLQLEYCVFSLSGQMWVRPFALLLNVYLDIRGQQGVPLLCWNYPENNYFPHSSK